MAEFRIRVVVDPSGATTGNRRVRGELQRTQTAAQGLQRVLARAFAFAGVGIGIRQLGSLSDSFINVRNSVNIATEGFGNSAETLDSVFAIANRVRAPVGAIGTLYQRAALAAGELGASNEELLEFVTAVGQGLAIQGTSANTARGALIQLSQAIGSDVVRAEEFNSILEGALPIAQAAARGIDEAGGSVARLRRLIIDGEISSTEFFNAILSQADELEQTFSNIEPTLSQAFTTLENGFIRAAEALLQFTGPLATFITDAGNAIAVIVGFEEIDIFPADQQTRIQTIIGLIQDLGDTAQAVGIFLAIDFARRGVGAAVLGLRSLTIAIVSNPLGALVTTIAAATAAFIAFSDRLTLTQGSAATVFDFLNTIGIDVLNAIRSGFEIVGNALNLFQGNLDNFDFGDFVLGAAQAIDRFIALFNAAFLTVVEQANNFAANVGEVVADSLNFINPFGDPLVARFSTTGRDSGDSFNANLATALANGGTVENAVQGVLDRTETRVREAQARLEEIARAETDTPGTPRPVPTTGVDTAPGVADRSAFLARELELLEREGEILANNALERDRLNAVLSLEESIRSSLRQANRDLTEEQLNNLAQLTTAEREQFLAIFENNRVQGIRAQILDSVTEPARRLNEELVITRQLLTEDPGNAMLIERIRELNSELAALDNSFSGGIQAGLARVIEQSNNLGEQVSGFVSGAFDQATQAVVNFATTGEFSIRQFFGQLAQQLLQIATNQLFSQLLGGLFGGFGGGGGGGGGLFGGLLGGLFGGLPGFQNGGGFTVGGSGGADSQVVAFRATPGERVDVRTPAQQNADQPNVTVTPQNVRIVNVIDPSEALGALNSDEGEEMILNIIERRRNEVATVVGGA